MANRPLTESPQRPLLPLDIDWLVWPMLWFGPGAVSGSLMEPLAVTAMSLPTAVCLFRSL